MEINKLLDLNEKSFNNRYYWNGLISLSGPFFKKDKFSRTINSIKLVKNKFLFETILCPNLKNTIFTRTSENE